MAVALRSAEAGPTTAAASAREFARRRPRPPEGAAGAAAAVMAAVAGVPTVTARRECEAPRAEAAPPVMGSVNHSTRVT